MSERDNLMNDLMKFSERELREAIEKKRELALKQEVKLQKEKNLVALKHMDALLALVPQHDRAGCDDRYLGNVYSGECRRCMLLDAKNSGYLTVWWEVEILVRKTGLPEDK